MSAIYLSVRGENMDANQIQNLFASNVRQLLVDADLDYDKLYEIRLRVGRPLFLTYDGENVYYGKKIQNLIWLRGKILRKHWSMSAAIPCMLMKMRFARGF